MLFNKIILFLAIASLTQTNIVVGGEENEGDFQDKANKVETFFQNHCFHAFSLLFSAFFMHNEIHQTKHRPAYGWHRNPNFFYSIGVITSCHQLQGIPSLEHARTCLSEDRRAQTGGTFLRTIIAPTLGALSIDFALRGWMHNENDSKYGAFLSLFGGLVAYKVGSSLQNQKSKFYQTNEDY